jgi:hypothetical protein
MEFIYVLIANHCWEDMVIYLYKEAAIEASINNPTRRVEIFREKDDFLLAGKGYSPTYNYYKNGEYIETN